MVDIPQDAGGFGVQEGRLHFLGVIICSPYSFFTSAFHVLLEDRCFFSMGNIVRVRGSVS